MTLNSSSNDPRLEQLRADHNRRMTRFFLTFAFVEGALLAAALIAVFILELVDPQLGVPIIIAIVVLGGLVMTVTLLTRMRAYQRDIHEISGH